MDDNFEKKLDIIFERIKTMIPDDSENKFETLAGLWDIDGKY